LRTLLPLRQPVVVVAAARIAMGMTVGEVTPQAMKFLFLLLLLTLILITDQLVWTGPHLAGQALQAAEKTGGGQGYARPADR
jgi:hypothetical protein